MAVIHSLLILTSIAAACAQQKVFNTPHEQSTIKGPHITDNFPDPCVIHHGGITYAFATNNRKPRPDRINIQVATSGDNETWSIAHGVDALPRPAVWQTGNAVWAPDVKQLPDGTFMLYYTDALKHHPQTHCIGAATSPSIVGPYTPLEVPYICPVGGAIDPAGFLDRSSGRRYILYKIDGNSLGHGGSCNNDVEPIESTPIMLQEVDRQTGLDFNGEPVQILDRDARDGPLIEAPSMHLSPDGVYFLFYSSNCFTSDMYATNYATANNINGPYLRSSESLLLTGDVPGLVGPGGMDIAHYSYADGSIKVSNDTTRLVLFHGIMPASQYLKRYVPLRRNRWEGRAPSQPYSFDFIRGMYSAQVKFEGHHVTVEKLESSESSES